MTDEEGYVQRQIKNRLSSRLAAGGVGSSSATDTSPAVPRNDYAIATEGGTVEPP